MLGIGKKRTQMVIKKQLNKRRFLLTAKITKFSYVELT
jgi:hypothetical protein